MMMWVELTVLLLCILIGARLGASAWVRSQGSGCWSSSSFFECPRVGRPAPC